MDKQPYGFDSSYSSATGSTGITANTNVTAYEKGLGTLTAANINGSQTLLPFLLLVKQSLLRNFFSMILMLLRTPLLSIVLLRFLSLMSMQSLTTSRRT